MASQDLFPYEDIDGSQSFSLSQLDGLSDVEKPMSSGTEEALNEVLQVDVGVDMKDLSGYIPYAGETVWPISETQPEQLTQPFDYNGYTAPAIVQLPSLPAGYGYNEVPVLFKTDEAGGMSLSQTSNQSVDDGIPSMESWKGDYNFEFSLETGTTRKFQFSTANNKLFCLPQQEIELFFTYDFAKCKSSDMSMTAFLRYTKPDCAAIPVNRCALHLSEDQAKLDSAHVDINDRARQLLWHVLKCNNKKAEYREDERTRRCSIRVPMGRPQPGVSKISQFFKFDCLNSCKPQQIKKKSPIAVVFELFERTRVVGRIAFNVRVCSCPGRDFMKEEPELVDGVPVVAKKRKSSEVCHAKENDVNSPTTSEPKRCRKLEVDDDEERERALENVAKSRRISCDPITLRTPKVELPPVSTDVDPFLSSSQESHGSDDDLRESLSQSKLERFRDMQKMAKWVLKLGYSENRILNELGRNFARTLRSQVKIASMLLESVNKNKAAGELQNERTATGSPDSGINMNTNKQPGDIE